MQRRRKNRLKASIWDKSPYGIIVTPKIVIDLHFVLFFDKTQRHLINFVEELLFFEEPKFVEKFHHLPMNGLSNKCLTPIYPSFQVYVPLKEHFIASVYCFKDNKEKATGSTFPYKTVFQVLYLLPLFSNSFFSYFMAL